MLKIFRSELSKLKRSMVWLAITLLPLISVSIGTLNYMQNLGALQQEWYSLWTQVCLFYNYFFFPAMVAVICSYLCRLEHKGNNWNLLLSQPVSIPAIYLAKFLTGTLLTCITQFLLAVFYILAGISAGLVLPLPEIFWMWVARSCLCAAVIVAVQLLVSLLIKSFALPIGVAIAGSISGLLMFMQNWGLFSPYALLTVGTGSAAPVETLSSSMKIGFYISAVTFLLLFGLLGVLVIRRRVILR